MPVLPPLPDDAARALLWVGFSGGLDSTVLLHCLASDERYRSRLRAVHVHHGLQAQADDWARQCLQVCDGLGVALTVQRVQVQRDGGSGLEAAARAARYQAFKQVMAAGDVLVTAHHLDDQAETFLLRALRASGPDGLAAMRQWRPLPPGWHWRPLLRTARSALHGYAQSQDLRWIEDPSNQNIDHDRNFLRQQVMPLLQQRWPHVHEAFAQSAALSAQASDLLAADDARALAAVVSDDPHIIRVPALRALAHGRRPRVLRAWVASLGLPPLPAQGLRHVERDLLGDSHDTQACFRWQDIHLQRWRDQLHVGRLPAPLPAHWQASWDGSSALSLPNGDVLQLVGAAALPWTGQVRARHGGERITLAGAAQHHTLKNLLQQTGIPPWQRANLPLLHGPDGELMAVGDRLHAGVFKDWLQQHGARLHWQRQSELPGKDALT